MTKNDYYLLILRQIQNKSNELKNLINNNEKEIYINACKKTLIEISNQLNNM